MAKKLFILCLILAVVIVSAVIIIIIVNTDEVIKSSDVLSADVKISRVKYGDYGDPPEERYVDLNVTLQGEDVEDVLKLEQAAKKHKHDRTINLMPWELIITYNLKDGRSIERVYRKNKNDALFESFLDKYYERGTANGE